MRKILSFSLITVLASLAAISSVSCSRPEAEAPARPNVLLIVVDDMGFADLGSFGGEIPTPHLDALALDGVRLSNFIAAAACSPTRAMLLTGVDAHKAGLGNLDEELAPNQRGKPGYEGFLNDRVVTIASLLEDSGYHTYLSGKWHLGLGEDTSPFARGFERAFAMLTNASHFADMRPAYSPDPDALAKYRDESGKLDSLPEDFDYSSQYYVDRMLDYLEADKDSGKPFFAYLAYSAPHWPLQAPDEAIEAVRGNYDEGYDVILERRLAEQRRVGLVPPDTREAERAPKGRPWADLNEDERRTEARAMEVYAAMIAEIDRHTGRLIEYLRNREILDDTVVIFLSDNGAEGHDYDDTWPAEAFPAIRATIDSAHDFSFEQMGRPGSYTFYGPNWARASSPAFRLYKAFPTEGGVRTAAFARYPGRFAAGDIVDELVLVKDLAPTILELAGITHPGDSYEGRAIEPMTGQSALPILEGEPVDAEPRVHADELIGKLGVRVGDWKLVKMPPPYGSGDWQLYDLATDMAEQNDLAADRPDKVRELSQHWDEYAAENGVVLPDWVSGY